jgi:hypothetical protein
MDGITSGKRLMSSNQYALHVGQVLFRSGEALYQRRAVSIDYTNEMWFKRVAEHDAAWVIWKQRLNEAYPILSPFEAGQLIGNLAAESDFTFLDDWLTDYIGHKGTIEEGNAHLEKVDDVMRGILSVWDMEGGLILLTSDHGNMESIDERGHTTNPVPLLVVGRGADDFAAGITDLSGLAPAIRRTFSL